MQIAVTTKNLTRRADGKRSWGILELQTAGNAENKKRKKSHGKASQVEHAFPKSKSAKRQGINVNSQKVTWKGKIRAQEEGEKQ